MARTLSSVEQEPAPYLIRGLRSPDRDNRGLGTHSYDSSHDPSSSSFMTRFGNTLLEGEALLVSTETDMSVFIDRYRCEQVGRTFHVLA